MSDNAKLDQSLDSILAARKKNAPRQLRRRAPVGTKAVATPVGGVKKTQKGAKKTDTQKTAAKSGPPRRDSKIIVSNLPADVTETQIKEYFTQSVGPVKSAILSYNQNGQSRGIANITFNNGAAAAKAYKELNTVKVDGRPMKVEVIIDGRDAPAPPEAKKLADRIAQPKNAAKPKSAIDVKSKKAIAGKTGGRDVKGAKGKRPGPRTKKTAEQLDAEMTDYFQAGTEAPATTNGGAVQPPADAPMADDI